jgi:hypothetical protein
MIGENVQPLLRADCITFRQVKICELIGLKCGVVGVTAGTSTRILQPEVENWLEEFAGEAQIPNSSSRSTNLKLN